MNLPTQSTPERTVGANGEVHSESPFTVTEVNDKPGFRRCIRRPGYVLDDGIDQTIEGSLRVGYGHQLLISHPGQNDLTEFEKVATSTFGKGFGKEDTARPGAKVILTGSVQDFGHEKFEEMVITGVASDRRDPDKEPAGGRAQEAESIVRVGSGTNADKLTWYARSTLGQRFGQAPVDEEINGFRVDADQEAPLPPTRQAYRSLCFGDDLSCGR